MNSANGKNETIGEGGILSTGQSRDASYDGERMKDGEYTQEYLQFVFGFVDEYYQNQNGSEKTVKVLSAGLMADSVEVGLFDLTEENIMLFKENVIDSVALEFVKGEIATDV